MKKIIVANWKMNPRTFNEARVLARSLKRHAKFRDKTTVIVAPPFVYFPLFGKKNLLAAQNAFYEDKGAFTGEISPAMLKSIGVKYVIFGHSERREQAGETDKIINAKILLAAVIKNNIV